MDPVTERQKRKISLEHDPVAVDVGPVVRAAGTLAQRKVQATAATWRTPISARPLELVLGHEVVGVKSREGLGERGRHRRGLGPALDRQTRDQQQQSRCPHLGHLLQQIIKIKFNQLEI